MSEQEITVILADDHPAVRAGIRQSIERTPGCRVLAEVDDGTEALDLVRSRAPNVAVVDLQMPGLTGLDVMGQARKEGLDTKFVVLTAYDDDP